MQTKLNNINQINNLQPKGRGIVYFDSDPHHANVYVDGQILTDPDTEEPLYTPMKVLLIEGRRDFTITARGYEDAHGYVDVFAGVSVNVYKRLKPGKSEGGWGEPEPQIWLSQSQQYQQLQQTGTLKIYSYPDGADIYIDGKPVGKTPVTIIDVPPGARHVTFKMPGMMDEEKTVDIYPGAWSDVTATMRPILPSLYQISSQTTYQIQTLQTPTTGRAYITTYPTGATIKMDNRTVVDADTKQPLQTSLWMDIHEGLHDLEFSIPGYCNTFSQIYVLPGGKYNIDKILHTC